MANGSAALALPRRAYNLGHGPLWQQSAPSRFLWQIYHLIAAPATHNQGLLVLFLMSVGHARHGTVENSWCFPATHGFLSIFGCQTPECLRAPCRALRMRAKDQSKEAIQLVKDRGCWRNKILHDCTSKCSPPLMPRGTGIEPRCWRSFTWQSTATVLIATYAA